MDPFSHLARNPAADNNKQYILEALQRLQLLNGQIFEIGSGPGQHGIYMCQKAPQLIWQPTEMDSKLPLTLEWHKVSQEQGVMNYLTPYCFHIGRDEINAAEFDVIYSANVLHIISEELAQHLAQQLVATMKQGQKLVCYGPFNKEGQFTTESNYRFNQWLLNEGFGGIKDLADIPKWTNNQLQLVHVEDMPANNFIVVYQKQ